MSINSIQNRFYYFYSSSFQFKKKDFILIEKVPEVVFGTFYSNSLPVNYNNSFNFFRIDLPKFQPEILQICQYGNDAQLFNLYPEVKKMFFLIIFINMWLKINLGSRL